MSSIVTVNNFDDWHHWRPSNLDSLEELLTVSSINKTDSSRPVSPIVETNIEETQELLTGYHPLQSTILALLAIPIRLWHNHNPMKPGSLTSIQTIPPSTFQFQNSLLAARTDLQHPNHFFLYSSKISRNPRLPHDFLFLPSTRIDSKDSPSLSLSRPP